MDLKGFNERRYRALGGSLSAVTDTIRSLHQRGIWVEVVTLLVPGFNDDDQELTAMAEFIASVSRDVPWHLTAFHPDYRMTDPPATQASDLLRAVEFGVEAGLRFVYAGNLPGQVVPWEDTRCPRCGETLIRRQGFRIAANRLSHDGRCPRCQCAIPGLWQAPGRDAAATPCASGHERCPTPVLIR